MGEQDRTRVPRGEARERIVAAATELFGRQGYEATTTRQIVEAAQVTKGALYHWFSSKEELLTSIYRELLAEQTSRLEAIAAAGGPADARLHRAVTDLFAHMDDHAEPLTVWARSMHLVAGEHAAAVREPSAAATSTCSRTWSRRGRRPGCSAADVAASVVTNTFLSSVVQIHRWFHAEGPLTRRELGSQMVALFLDGVRVA